MSDAVLDYKDLLGKPFAENGIGPDSYDCRGLAIECYHRLGRYFPADFSCETNPEKIAAIVKGYSILPEFMQLDNPSPYCIVSLIIVRPWVSHFGIMLRDCSRFLHIYRGGRVCVDRIESLLWGGKIDGYWEHATWGN